MAHALLPDPKALTLENIVVREGIITFHIGTTTAIAACPDCGSCSERVHSRYQRTLQDLPWQGNAVCFRLTVRRFFCGNTECKRKIFAEEPINVARRYRRKTSRLDDLLLQLVWKVGGESAAAIARLIGLLLSPDSALYGFKKSSPQTTMTKLPEVLGIDDFAFRRGQTYGTILIDLTTRTPVDLLPNREKVTVEKWFKEHPGAKIVSRDRSAVFADAIREGAPDAIHIADRFHLLANLMETLQTQIGKESKAIRDVLVPKLPETMDEGPVALTRRQQRAKEESRKRRFEKWQKVYELHGQGYFKKEIARMVDLDIHTVRKYLKSEAFPEKTRSSPVNGALAPHKEYILSRWEVSHACVTGDARTLCNCGAKSKSRATKAVRPRFATLLFPCESLVHLLRKLRE
jgi:transposase